MGNNQSNPSSRPSSAHLQQPSHSSSPPSHHISPKRAISRRDPRHLAQRTAAKAEPSLTQAQRSNVAQSKSDRDANLLHQQSLSRSVASTSASSKSEEPKVRTPEPSKPVDCPIKPTLPEGGDSSRVLDTTGTDLDPLHPSASTQDMSYHLTRPPRMPLPIEKEVHTPGSPIIPPLEPGDTVPILDVVDGEEGTLERQPSGLSNGTAEEDEEYAIDKTKATVPTTIEWREGGNKVYVTGTIFQWNKKHRLHPVFGRPDVVSAEIHIRPGTHHIRFIVDGDMKCSTKLPTTVDFGNNLVNYIEIRPADLPEDSVVEETSKTQQETKTVAEGGEGIPRKPKTKNVPSPSRYTREVPQYLDDLDKSEDSSAYQLAAAAIEKLPTPPSLPGFLAKPILNAATPMKDDNSVLTMPNHTVLNHLGTSSIKDDTLAVSVTTRYKRKYVTTIMYMPTSTND